MRRLTSYDAGNEDILVNEEEGLLSSKGFIDKDEMYKIMRHLAEKVFEYENLEEQGLLLRLPCKVGDIVYRIINQRDNYDGTVYQIVSSIIFELSMIDKIGKTVFLTKAEAEQKLKEMEDK